MRNHNRWYPICTQRKNRPGPGDLIANSHAVWRVTEVGDAERTPEEAAEFAAHTAERAAHGHEVKRPCHATPSPTAAVGATSWAALRSPDSRRVTR